MSRGLDRDMSQDSDRDMSRDSDRDMSQYMSQAKTDSTGLGG